MASTLKDIAAEANTSVSTVSRVLNGLARKFSISRETEQRVLRAAKKLRYKPNPLARGLRLKKTLSVGLVVPDITNPFFADVTRTIQREVHEWGYSLIVCNTDDVPTIEAEHIDLLLRKHVDGLVIMPVGQDVAHLKSVVDSGVPLVFLDRCFDGIDVNSVLLDNRKGGFMATELLIQHGHRHVAIIQGRPRTYTSDERLAGYLDAMRSAGLTVNEAHIVGDDFREESGYAAMEQLLETDPRPTAIFSVSEVITLGVLKVIAENELRVPQDFSIVSFDDLAFAPVLASPLSTVAQPGEAMGKAAVKLLLEQINAEKPGEIQHIVFQPQLIVRKSVTSPRGIPQSEMTEPAGR